MRRPASACVSRRHPASRWRPGSRRAARLIEYERHGTASLLAACPVQTGQVHGLVRQRHRSADFIELLQLLDSQVPKDQLIHLILDPVRRHCSAEVALSLAYRPWRFRFHWLPKHASGLSFIEVWFAILSKKCLKRSELTDFAAAERHITAFIATYNAHHAHPFTWRKGIRFYQRLKDKLVASQVAATTLPLAA
jgi:transposase